jgi:hypothetical protein
MCEDLPRLIKNIEIITDGERIVEKSTKPVEHEMKEEEDYLSRRRQLRNFLESLAIQLGDTKDTLPALIQNFDSAGENITDLAIHLRHFITNHMPDCKTLRCLKAINQVRKA